MTDDDVRDTPDAQGAAKLPPPTEIPTAPAYLGSDYTLDLDTITQRPTPEAPVTSPSPCLFIARPEKYEGGSGAIFAAAKKPRPPQMQLNDATHYIDRYHQPVQVLKILKGPIFSGRSTTMGLAAPDPDAVQKERVDFAMNLTIGIGKMPPLNAERATEFVQMDLALEHPYVVFFGRSISVDRGNHDDPAPSEWIDVGASVTMPHKGFDTFEEAVAYANMFME